MDKQIGAKISVQTDLPEATAAVTTLFNESQSRIVLTVSANNAAAALFLLENRGIPARRLGVVGGDSLEISVNGGAALSWPVSGLKEAWWNSIGCVMSAD
jgi:phosphoribosylformylglycinamidine synthase